MTTAALFSLHWDSIGVNRAPTLLPPSLQSVAAERVETALFAALDGETGELLGWNWPDTFSKAQCARHCTLRSYMHPALCTQAPSAHKPALLVWCADPSIASQIKATLSTLLAAGAAREPSHWVTLCAEVVTAAAPGSIAAAEEQAAAAAEAAAQDSDDEEGAVATKAPAPAAPPAAAPAPGPGGAAGAAAAAPRAPRLRTRLFAAQLLLQLPELVCSSGEQQHTDLGAAQAAVKAGQGGDWLVLRLQQLVDLAFRMASGQLEVRWHLQLVCALQFMRGQLSSSAVHHRGAMAGSCPASTTCRHSATCCPSPTGSAPPWRAPHGGAAGCIWRLTRPHAGGRSPDGAVPGTGGVHAAVSRRQPGAAPATLCLLHCGLVTSTHL